MIKLPREVVLKMKRFTSFEFYDEQDSPMIVTDGKRVEVYEYLDGLDGTGKRIFDPGWHMKGDEFGCSEINNPTHFIRQSDFLIAFEKAIY